MYDFPALDMSDITRLVGHVSARQATRNDNEYEMTHQPVDYSSNCKF